MTNHELDITGKVCPFCLLIVKQKLEEISAGDFLIVKCDHPPAATKTIPRAMEKANYPVKLKKLLPGLWELTIEKK
ncbi:sulfurtransferase TusA family protein [Candidatus Harpocratesius sp.]